MPWLRVDPLAKNDQRWVPLVIQYDKRALPGALPAEDLRDALNPFGLPECEANAIPRDDDDDLGTIARHQGERVFETFKAIGRLALLEAKRAA